MLMCHWQRGTTITGSEFPPEGIPRYTPAEQATVCVRNVSGSDVSLLRLAPVTIECANRCANETMCYPNNLPASAILGLNAVGRMDIWVPTSAQAGKRIKVCSGTRG